MGDRNEGLGIRPGGIIVYPKVSIVSLVLLLKGTTNGNAFEFVLHSCTEYLTTFCGQ